VDASVKRKYFEFVSVNLNPGLPPVLICVIKRTKQFNGDVDVVRLSDFFSTRPSLSTEVDFNVLVSSNIPEFSFVSVTENEVWNEVMGIK
jgi:hypothetical protein